MFKKGLKLLSELFDMLLPCMWEGRIAARARAKELGEEIGDLKAGETFLVEVLLDGRVVAVLTDRVYEEMFWWSYQITPADDDGLRAISNDTLWNECRFTLRQPQTGMICDTALVGGGSPIVRDSRVFFRSLYFRRQQPVTLP